MEKVGFPLKVDDGWPPYDAEHIWVESLGSSFKIKSFPFFIEGMAFDDEVRIVIDQDGYASSWETVLPSNNSLLWVIEHRPSDLEDQLCNLGCGIEREGHYQLVAVNVPASVNANELNHLITKYEQDGTASIAVPVDRMGLIALGDSSESA